MPDTDKVQQILETLGNLRRRLENIANDTRQSYDSLAGYERLFHWKARTIKYLNENVSKAESENLKNKGQKEPSHSILDFLDDVRLNDAILLAIIEALEDNPAYVLENLSPVNLNGSIAVERKDNKFACDVFVSYSSLDQEQADMIYNAIRKAGGKAFLSAKNLVPGEDFTEEIRKNLLESKEIWLLVSPNSLKSEWVTTEWGVAWVLQRNIIPILHRCSPADLPERLKRLQCIDFYEHPKLVKARFKPPNKTLKPTAR